MKTILISLWRDESGQDLIEYALLLTLIALVCAATIGSLGQAINNIFQNATVLLQNATSSTT